MEEHKTDLRLLPDNSQRLSNLCGRLNEHIKIIERALSLSIQQRGNIFYLSGPQAEVSDGCRILESLYKSTESGKLIHPQMIHLAIHEIRQPEIKNDTNTASNQSSDSTILIKTSKASVKPRGEHQKEYVKNIQTNDISFGIGPAGTGKTYLAVACAVEALMSSNVNRILLVRPAVEAGEKLGFLPGDLTQKIDPYLRPLYAALYEMLGFEKVGKLIERNIIEVAPLAFMRGRTLNHSFIILDESQNTTSSQMKMFLTRIGFGSTAVITGDMTQIDLPKGTRSGLVQVSKILSSINEIGFTYFSAKDVVRHRLVQRIVEAYDEFDQKTVSKINGKDSSQINERDS